MSHSLTHRRSSGARALANILPTDFGLQEPASTPKRGLRIVKVTVSGLQR